MPLHISRWTVLCLLFSAAMMTLTGCSSVRPTPTVPEAAPPMIMVDGQSLPSISFTKLFADIPGGRITGYHYDGLEYTRGYAHKWDENFINESDDFGYLAQEILGDAGYRAQDPSGGQLHLDATIRKLSYNSYSYKVDFDQAECELDWRLYRATEEEPFFTFVTNGEGRVDGGQSGAIRVAFELGLRRLMAAEDFVTAVGSQK